MLITTHGRDPHQTTTTPALIVPQRRVFPGLPRRKHPRLMPPATPRPAPTLGVDIVSGAVPTPMDSGGYYPDDTPVYALGVYTEFPFDLVKDVHFEQSKPPPPPDAPPDTHCCNDAGYGYGAIVGAAGPGLISALPYGPYQYPPFVGTFETDKTYGPQLCEVGVGAYGGFEVHPDPDPGSVTASAYGNHAASIFMDGSSLSFTTIQLAFSYTPIGQVRWIVPFAVGDYVTALPPPEYWLALPAVVDKYQIDMEWDGAVGYDYGIGICHPLTAGGLVPFPTEPAMEFGPGSSVGSYLYDFQYQKWASNTWPVIDSSNSTDPSIGGPAFLAWMQRRQGGDGTWGSWGSNSTFMSGTLAGTGTHYIWHITPTCIPEPPVIWG